MDNSQPTYAWPLETPQLCLVGVHSWSWFGGAPALANWLCLTSCTNLHLQTRPCPLRELGELVSFTALCSLPYCDKQETPVVTHKLSVILLETKVSALFCKGPKGECVCPRERHSICCNSSRMVPYWEDAVGCTRVSGLAAFR